jgi:hypothetical protein
MCIEASCIILQLGDFTRPIIGDTTSSERALTSCSALMRVSRGFLLVNKPYPMSFFAIDSDTGSVLKLITFAKNGF